MNVRLLHHNVLVQPEVQVCGSREEITCGTEEETHSGLPSGLTADSGLLIVLHPVALFGSGSSGSLFLMAHLHRKVSTSHAGVAFSQVGLFISL